MRRVAEAARASRITPLFALKSFPHPRVVALAAELLDGFDAASAAEVRGVPAGRTLSIADPSGAAIAHAPRDGRLIVSCETVEQVRAAPAHADIAIRISASITGRDPAVGAVLDGSGHRRSRFGLDDRTAVAALAGAAGTRRVGLHVHHGPITATTGERFLATARAALALLDTPPAFVDLGGAWHGVADLSGAFAEIRRALGEVEILVEPGRLYADGAGFAYGRVTARRELADRLLAIIDLSRICHLRWSQVDLVHKGLPRPSVRAATPSAPVVPRAAPPGTGVKVQLVGPTCYEEDVIGEWTVDPDDVAERIVLRDVSGYALAWNTSFGGVPAADVVLVD